MRIYCSGFRGSLFTLLLMISSAMSTSQQLKFKHYVHPTEQASVICCSSSSCLSSLILIRLLLRLVRSVAWVPMANLFHRRVRALAVENPRLVLELMQLWNDAHAIPY